MKKCKVLLLEDINEFANEISKHINNGYEVINSNASVAEVSQFNIANMTNIQRHKFFYALLIKNEEAL